MGVMAGVERMNKQQKIAIQNPCRFAFETMNPIFATAKPGMSVILSVNYGYE